MKVFCPVNGSLGKPVSQITLGNLLPPQWVKQTMGREWFYCAHPDCEIVYFSIDGKTIPKDALQVRVGVKEKDSPRPICYCFEHSVEDIAREVSQTGSSKIPDAITEKCRQGLDRCEETNPQGSCCLGNVRRVMKEAVERMLAMNPTFTQIAQTSEQHDCCSASNSDEGAKKKKNQAGRANLFAASGSVIAAILASACCWLPLLFIGFGASVIGAAAFFEKFRIPFLVIAALLLTTGFYLVYFRKEKCAPGSSCDTPNPKLRKWNRASLWVATALVLAFGLFPNYLGLLLGNTNRQEIQNPISKVKTVELKIQGMTCEGCARLVEKSLLGVAGVIRADVNYEDKLAAITIDSTSPPTTESLLQAVEQAGYSATLK